MLGLCAPTTTCRPQPKKKECSCNLSTQAQVILHGAIRVWPHHSRAMAWPFSLHNGSCPQLSSWYEPKMIRTMCISFFYTLKNMQTPPQCATCKLRFGCSTSKAPRPAHPEFVCRSRSRIFGVGIVCYKHAPASFLMRRGNIYTASGFGLPLWAIIVYPALPLNQLARTHPIVSCSLAPKQRMNGGTRTTTQNMAFSVI